jgi:hypothetical protein
MLIKKFPTTFKLTLPDSTQISFRFVFSRAKVSNASKDAGSARNDSDGHFSNAFPAIRVRFEPLSKRTEDSEGQSQNVDP